MKKVLILAAASVVSLTAMSSCGAGSAKMTTDTDTLAYAIGVQIGNMAYSFDSTLNPNNVAAGVLDVYAKKAKMTPEEIDAFMQDYMTVRLPRKKAEEGKAFIADAVKSGADTLAGGLAYKIEKPGAETKVAIGDTISVLYTLTLPEGQVLEKAEQPTQFVLTEGGLIKAWTMGLPLVGEGGKITLYVPGDLAYGPMGTRGIAPNQALQFDVEVVKVTKPAPKTEAETK